ncbi:hypothetical protein HaLaN_32204, partial [Haematococcus lacustris]
GADSRSAGPGPDADSSRSSVGGEGGGSKTQCGALQHFLGQQEELCTITGQGEEEGGEQQEAPSPPWTTGGSSVDSATCDAPAHIFGTLQWHQSSPLLLLVTVLRRQLDGPSTQGTAASPAATNRLHPPPPRQTTSPYGAEALSPALRGLSPQTRLRDAGDQQQHPGTPSQSPEYAERSPAVRKELESPAASCPLRDAPGPRVTGALQDQGSGDAGYDARQLAASLALALLLYAMYSERQALRRWTGRTLRGPRAALGAVSAAAGDVARMALSLTPNPAVSGYTGNALGVR